MAFKLAEAYVEFTTRGMSAVDKGIERVKGAFSGAGSFGDMGRGLTDALGSTLKESGSQLGSILGGAMGGAFGGALGSMLGDVVGKVMSGIGAVFSSMFSAAAGLESLNVSFKTMIGSAEGAKDMVQQLRDFAAATPFELTELGPAAKKLLAFQVQTEKVIPTLRMLGDVAALTETPIGDLALIYGKVMAKGRLMSEEMNQLSERGIPILSELAKKYGTTTGAILKMAEQGKISSRDFQGVLERLTGPGGKFAGGMAEQSKTLGGIWSTLKDDANNTFTSISTTLMEAFDIKGIMQTFSSLFGLIGDIWGLLTDIIPIGGLIGGAFEMVLAPIRWVLDAMRWVVQFARELWGTLNDILPIGWMLAKVFEAITWPFRMLGSIVSWVGEKIMGVMKTIRGYAKAFWDWILGRETAKKSEVDPLSSGQMGPQAQPSFVGISQLAEKMQIEALKQNENKAQLEAANKTADATKAMADQAKGDGLFVRIIEAGSALKTGMEMVLGQ